MDSNFIVHVSETDFQIEVLAHSRQRPVVVDFWAEWSAACQVLDPLLEKLAEEAGGAFRLAKLDVDTNARIASDYGVKDIPAVKGFRNGQVVSEFSGLRPEPTLRDFLKELAPTSGDLALGRANSRLVSENYVEAEDMFREVLATTPDHPGALLGLARTLLAQGEAAPALPILRAFPASKEYSAAEHLLPLAQALADLEMGELRPPSDDEEGAAGYVHALRLACRGQMLASMDGLLDVLRNRKHPRREEARQVLLGLLQVLGENNPHTRAYRAELAALLF
ncbi:MAG: tetratricopeptide repeat protein [Anaerolineales bacterium]